MLGGIEIPFFALAKDRKRAGTILVDGLFYALPVESAPTTSRESILGEWDCKDPDLSVYLSAKGEQVTAQVSGFPTATGTLRHGIARFVVHSGKESYDATASLDGANLDLKWKNAGVASGEATCTSALPIEKWSQSKALVPLYFYDPRNGS